MYACNVSFELLLYINNMNIEAVHIPMLFYIRLGLHACITIVYEVHSYIFAALLPFMQPFNFPADVSFSFGGPGSPRYFVNQIHYDNPNGVAGTMYRATPTPSIIQVDQSK